MEKNKPIVTKSYGPYITFNFNDAFNALIHVLIGMGLGAYFF